MPAFLTAALVSALCTLAVLVRLTREHRLNIVALTVDYGAGFLAVMWLMRQGA